MNVLKEEVKPLIRIEGVPFPMRVKSASKNKKNWEAMTAELERRVLALAVGGYAVDVRFDVASRGVVIVATLVGVMRSPFGMVVLPVDKIPKESETPAPPKTEVSPHVRHLFEQTFLRVEAAAPEAAKKVLETCLKKVNAEILRELSRLSQEHAEEHAGHTDCDAGAPFQRMKEGIDDLLRTRLS